MLVDVIITLRILVEIALFALIGQGALYLLSGANREQNVFYMVLKTSRVACHALHALDLAEVRR